MSTNKNLNIFKWIISFAVPLLIFMVPLTETFTPEVRSFMAITSWAVFCMATEIIPTTLTGMMLPVFYILLNVATPAEAYAPWTTSVVWISMGGIIVANILMSSGLSERIAYFTIIKTGGTFTGTLIGIMLAGIIINPFVPSVMGKLAIMVPIALGICKALDLVPKSRGASAVMIAAFLSIAEPRLGFLTGDGAIPMMMGIIQNITNISISWGEFAFHNLFINLIFSAISIGILIIVLKPEEKIDKKDVILANYKALGSMSSSEKKVATLLFLAILALMTDSIHKIDPAWIFMLIGFVCFLPGVNLMDEKKLGNLNYKILIFIAGCMSIGMVAQASGAGQWLSSILFPLLEGASNLRTSITVWFFGVILNFLLTPLAALSSFTGPITEVCIQAGINPVPIMYSFLQGLDHYLLPYEFAGLLFVFSYGYISMKDLIKVLLPRMIAGLIFLAVIAYPYWNMIGLFK